jgi:hypothetical protein
MFNRGSGQPINQPNLGGGWVPGQPDFMGGTPLMADNMQQQLQAAGRLGMGGSLQSLGGGRPLNQPMGNRRQMSSRQIQMVKALLSQMRG